jgi:hypothetical protein
MQSLKITITLLVLIFLGIVVGSNFSTPMTIIMLSQPTISLPIGIWLAIAIGLGLLSSSVIQILLFLTNRRLDRKVRQLQSRLQQSDEDIFTYTSAAAPKPANVEPQPEEPSTPEAADLPNTKKSLFGSYRANIANKFNRVPTRPEIVDDNDDWDAEPAPSRQLEWDEVRSSSRQASPNNNFSTPRSQPISRHPEVYDADFRLIQPPYREPSAVELDDEEEEAEDFEYTDRDENEDSSSSPLAVESISENRDPKSTLTDDEDWGFDFDEDDTPKNTVSRNQKF